MFIQYTIKCIYNIYYLQFFLTYHMICAQLQSYPNFILKLSDYRFIFHFFMFIAIFCIKQLTIKKCLSGQLIQIFGLINFFYNNVRILQSTLLYKQHIFTMKVSCEHIASNCNPMPNTLQFLDHNTIAYCFRNQVGLYLLDQNKVMLNLNYRQEQINRANCLACINPQTIVVGYDSGHLIVYHRQAQQWEVLQVIKQDTAITLIHFNQDTIITNNISAQIVFYSVDTKLINLQQIDSIRFPLNKILQSIVQISHNGYKIMFMGGTDQKIHCYTRQSNADKLVYRFQLAGHENAITKLTITQHQNDYLLASSSKDGYIRLWRLTENQQITKFHKSVKSFNKVYCFLDAVLISHQSSVTNLRWVKFTGQIQLVSCSLDCTICVWGYEQEGSAWTVDTRMGQLLGNKNAYFNIVADPSYKYLVAVNYIGSALIWGYNQQTKKYTLRPSFNGHSNQVKDIDWNHTGDFLVSVSKDQTTRIISRNQVDNLFHEISRAQIHGYDINSVSVLKVNDGIIDLIACGADEKVIRIVEPPACFANYLNYSTKANLHLFFPSEQEEKKYTISKPGETLEYETYAEGGTQVLGLMTKVQRVQRQKISSYYDDEQQEAQEEEQKVEDNKEAKINFTLPPHDDYLVKHTLWPEMNKLYGHPHEISALAKNNKNRLLASSCEGKNKTFCRIIIWSTQDWKIKKMIEHHSYTVYGMDFSDCGKYFSSVSKDRKLAVFDQTFEVLFSYEAHARAITCVSFSPDSKFVATGSRDKSIKIHNIADKKTIKQYDVKKQVHAVAFCGVSIVAVGCIDGTILFLSFTQDDLKQIHKIEDRFSHTNTITKLRYKNGLLASSGQDHSVRVFKLHLQN